MAKSNTWIIDGHNVIYHVPHLERLQTSGEKRDAREMLAEVCLSFAARRGEPVVVVFDGVPGFTEGARESGYLEVTYAQYEGKADDVIVWRTDRTIHDGGRVTVVTNDQDLKSRLHRNASAIGCAEFWKLTKPPRRPTGEQRPNVPLQDVEAYFLEQEARILAELKEKPEPRRRIPPKPDREPSQPPHPEKRRDPDPRKPDTPKKEKEKPVRPEPSAAEKLRLKKERGRRKQARRLERKRKQ